MNATMVAPPRSLEQRLSALDKANEVRIGAAAAKKEIQVGKLPMAEALEDPRCGGMRVWKLLMQKPGWGAVRVNRLLSHNAISPNKRVDGLTARQRATIIGELDRKGLLG